MAYKGTDTVLDNKMSSKEAAEVLFYQMSGINDMTSSRHNVFLLLPPEYKIDNIKRIESVFIPGCSIGELSGLHYP